MFELDHFVLGPALYWSLYQWGYQLAPIYRGNTSLFNNSNNLRTNRLNCPKRKLLEIGSLQTFLEKYRDYFRQMGKKILYNNIHISDRLSQGRVDDRGTCCTDWWIDFDGCASDSEGFVEDCGPEFYGSTGGLAWEDGDYGV